MEFDLPWTVPIPDVSGLELPVRYDSLNSAARRAVRVAYERRQRGKCYYCKGKLDQPPQGVASIAHIQKGLFPPGFFSNPVHLHHDHHTGMTLGAVHCKCNAVLFQYHGE